MRHVINALALFMGTALMVAACDENDAAERRQEAQEEVAEGTAEATAAARGENELEQELAGARAEDSVEDAAEARELREDSKEGGY